MPLDVIIIVARDRGRFYVLGPMPVSESNKESVKAKLTEGECKYTRDRGKALVIAHDIQSKEATELGVWEVRLSHDERSDPE